MTNFDLWKWSEHEPNTYIPFARCEFDSAFSHLLRLPFSHLLRLSSGARLLDLLGNEPIIHGDRRPVTEEHADLHHPPVRRGVHLKLPIEDRDLEDGHPPEEADLE